MLLCLLLFCWPYKLSLKMVKKREAKALRVMVIAM